MCGLIFCTKMISFNFVFHFFPFILKGRVRERETQRGKYIPTSLVHSPNGHHGHKAGISFRSAMWVQTPRTWSIICCYSQGQ